MAENNNMKKINIIAIGRGSREDAQGKVALTMYREDSPWLEAVNEETTFDPAEISLRNVLIAKIVDSTRAMLDNGFKGIINVYTLREGIVLKYYEIAKKMSEAHKNGTPFDVTSCFYDFMNEGDKAAIAELADTIAEALEKGCLFRISDVSLVNYLELVVPEGVELHNGDKLNFVNGTAENGVTVRGWKTFARKDAEVRVMNENRYPVYVLRRSLGQNMPRRQAKLADVVTKLWAKCPQPDMKTTEQKGTAAGLVA